MELKEYQKKYYQENKERMAERRTAYNKSYYQKNKTKAQEYYKKYYRDRKNRMSQIDKVLPTPGQVDELVEDMTAIEGTAEKYMEEMHHEKEIGDMLIRLIPRLKDIWNHF
ncbi:MAG: hypothetical protein GY804_02650, partial [Alphaproteobacteria bacterium]|nr:hypothetical protein [Alphaproteobacteria bacterium]